MKRACKSFYSQLVPYFNREEIDYMRVPYDTIKKQITIII